MKLWMRIWNWLRSFLGWRRTSVPVPVPVYPPTLKPRAVGITTVVPDVEPEEKAPMVRCPFCHRRTRLGRPCCNWRYLVIVAASLHIGGRRNPRRGFTDRISGHARASGQRRFRTRMVNRRRMRERSIKANRGLL